MNATSLPDNTQGTARTTILLVDDDPGILEGVADLLTLSDFDVLTAQDGHSALGVMNTSTPDLIVSDIMMPDMDGYDFYEAVRSNPNWTTIPFIFLTARGQRTDISRGNRLGADHYIVKPFEPEDLLSAITGRLKRVRDIEMVVRSDVEQMKQQLITIFSHELRTPLTYIYGYVNLLQDNGALDDREMASQMIDGIRKGAERLVNLVEDLMLLVRVDSGVVGMEIQLRSGSHSLTDIVQDAVSKCSVLTRESRVQIHVDIPEELHVLCMRDYVMDSVRRLVENGIKFAKRTGGDVWVRAQQTCDMVRVEVEDNGIGIEAAQLAHIFERFRQIDRPMMEQQGVGLGLTICQALVHLHMGEMSVTSQPGVGSTFAFTLPLAEEVEQ